MRVKMYMGFKYRLRNMLAQMHVGLTEPKLRVASSIFRWDRWCVFEPTVFALTVIRLVIGWYLNRT